MICPKCGENLPDSARVCDTCGASVHRTVAPPKEEGETVVQIKNEEKPAGPFFNQIFSSKGYFWVLITMTAMRLVVFINEIVLMTQLKWVDALSNVLSLGVSLVMLVPMWMLYARSYSDDTKDYVNSLKIFRIYTLVLLGVTAFETVLVLVLAWVLTGFSITAVVGAVGYGFIALFPYYYFYKFIDSLHKSAINDRVKLEGIGVIIALTMIFAILLLVALPIMLIMLVIGSVNDFGDSTTMTVLTYFATTAFLFVANDWLRKVRKLAED